MTDFQDNSKILITGRIGLGNYSQELSKKFIQLKASSLWGWWWWLYNNEGEDENYFAMWNFKCFWESWPTSLNVALPAAQWLLMSQKSFELRIFLCHRKVFNWEYFFKHCVNLCNRLPGIWSAFFSYCCHDMHDHKIIIKIYNLSWMIVRRRFIMIL